MKPWNFQPRANEAPFILSNVPFGSQLRTVDHLLARAEHYANSSMQEVGHLKATFFILGIDGPQMLTATSLGSDQAKDDFVEVARLLTVARAANVTVMGMEAWAVFAKPGHAVDVTKAPSESVDRQELIVLMGEEPGRQQQRILPIIRNEAGRFTGFGKSQLSQIDKVKGRFADLLAPQAVSAEQRKAAEVILRARGIVTAADFSIKRGPRFRM